MKFRMKISVIILTFETKYIYSNRSECGIIVIFNMYWNIVTSH